MLILNISLCVVVILTVLIGSGHAQPINIEARHRQPITDEDIYGQPITGENRPIRIQRRYIMVYHPNGGVFGNTNTNYKKNTL